MTRRPHRFGHVLALATFLLPALATAAHARVFAVNACVSAKQKRAADYCRRALDAWAQWEVDQNNGHRDAALARGASKLEGRWARAEKTSLADGSDCEQTTTTADDARSIVDDAASGLTGAVNGGLDLGSHSQAQCGRQLLEAAAIKCRKLLLA